MKSAKYSNLIIILQAVEGSPMRRPTLLVSVLAFAICWIGLSLPSYAGAAQAEIQPYFIKQASIFKQKAPDFGLSDVKLEELINAVCFRMYREKVPYIPGVSIERLGLLIRKEVDTVIKESKLTPSTLLKQWLYAEGVCAWVRTHVTYDNQLGNLPGDIQKKRTSSQEILKSTRPTAICSGYALLTRDLSRVTGKEVGLKCYYVGGWARDYNGETPKESNHSWNCFEFTGEIQVPADTTASAQTIDEALRCKWKTGVEWILPRTQVTWELFLARRFGVIKTDDNIYSYFEPSTIKDKLSSLKFEQWSARNIGYLRELQRRLDNLETR